jgi:hypothetical protein
MMDWLAHHANDPISKDPPKGNSFMFLMNNDPMCLNAMKHKQHTQKSLMDLGSDNRSAPGVGFRQHLTSSASHNMQQSA